VIGYGAGGEVAAALDEHVGAVVNVYVLTESPVAQPLYVGVNVGFGSLYCRAAEVGFGATVSVFFWAVTSWFTLAAGL
jgi:hypothetical protein